MDIKDAVSCKTEVQQKIAEILKDFESNTQLSIENIEFVRQSQYDNIGNEIGFTYIVEAKVYL